MNEFEAETKVGSSESHCLAEIDVRCLPKGCVEIARSDSAGGCQKVCQTTGVLSLLYLSRRKGGMMFSEISKSIPAHRINILRGICRSSDSKIWRMTEVMHT